MNTTRMAILGVASLAGIGAVGVVLHSVASSKSRPPPVAAPPAAPTARVLVAKHDLQVGDKVAPGDMTWQPWPAQALNPAFIIDGAPSAAPVGQMAALTTAARNALANPADGKGAAFLGSIVRERILANEPIIASKLVQGGGAGVMAVTLNPGMRAVALPLTPESAAGGFILPGDHVDVLLTRSVDAQAGAAPNQSITAGHITSTVMRNVRVLAVDQNTGAQKTASVVGATATVECSPDQAEYLVLAKASGAITLMLRSYADAKGGASVGAQARQGPTGMMVRVYRNSAFTPVTVTK